MADQAPLTTIEQFRKCVRDAARFGNSASMLSHEAILCLCDAADAKDAEIAELRQRAEKAEADARRWREWLNVVFDKHRSRDMHLLLDMIASARTREQANAALDALAASQPAAEEGP